MAKRLPIAVGAACLVGLILCHAAQPPQAGPETEKRFPPLHVPPGFKATLFACDPLIEYPSVISIGPRPGAIFVAYDYMTGLDHLRRDEVRLVEDTDGDGYADKATLFAAGFNSIQGMAYHDSVLYVMHAPFLTALRDTKKAGAADERKDLLSGLGLTPENNKTLLHCANGVAVGHDGWLYLALGDNGVNVQRPEGDRLILNGGGILRCRPDGRDLHVFSTGLRNIYDVALDAELNVFVRDNENDGGTYMIRVCHSFHGADHGYPYHYEDYPEEALHPIGDFGRGSAAGGVCYLETQFPPEYRGNLFFGEWGKSVVRYPLTRAGSGFAPVKEIEFAVGDRKDTYPFKPTDIIVQRDGTMMIADFADGQRPKRGRGRIYHVVYAGGGTAPARKQTYPALDSESYYDRWEAQANLERDGKRAANLGPRGRMHALWALAHREGAKAVDELLRIAASDPDSAVRAQAVRAVADLTDPILTEHKLDAGPGDVKRAEQLAALAKGQDSRVMLEIVVALGRLRWTGSADWLRAHVVHPDKALAHAAMQTMRRAANWPAVLGLLDQPDDNPLRMVALRALAERYEPEVIDGLIGRLGLEQSAERRRAYAEALTRVYKKPGPWKYWGYRPGPKPANTEPWQRTEAIAIALDRALVGLDGANRLTLLKRMQREKVPVPPARLGEWLVADHQPERAAAFLALLSDQSTAEVPPYLQKVIHDRQHSTDNRLTALALLGKKHDRAARGAMLEFAQGLEDGPVLADVLRRLSDYPQLAPATLLVRKISSADAGVRAAAMHSLGELRAEEAREPLLKMLHDTAAPVRRAAAGAAGKLALKEAAESLLTLMTDADAAVRVASLDSLRLLREARVVPLALRALSDRPLELKALATLGELGGPEHAGAVADLAKRNPSADVLSAAVRVLANWGDREGLSAPGRQALELAIADVQGATGVPVLWHGGGPFPLEDRPRIVDRHAFAGKAALEGRALFAAGMEGRVLIAAKDAAKEGVWFAHADMSVSAPTAVEFMASSRGTFHVWLNGKPIHERAKARNYEIDSDRFAGSLEKGTNRLLVATSSANAAAEFHLRFRRKSSTAEHERLTQAALSRTGNSDRGRKLFLDAEKSQCLKCHQLGKQGERIGPELTGVGGRFSRIHLVESILEPSRAIAPSFGSWTVTMKSGKTVSGVKVSETETTLTLADNQGLKQTLLKNDIEEQQPSAISIMPDGIERRLTEEEFVDLIAFLASQKDDR
jgi:putative membrane-bound dehydrogenase-like protein